MPSPGMNESAFDPSSLTKSASSGRATTARLVAVQRWPVAPNAPAATLSAAFSRSASARTMTAFLPPISSWTRQSRCAARA